MNRKRAEAEFLRLVQGYGLSPESPEDGWKMAFALFMRWKPRRRSKTGPRPSNDAMACDLIMLLGLHVARRDGDTRGEHAIIRDLAKYNGWRTDEAAINTKWRRLQDLKKRRGNYFKNAAEALVRDIPKNLWKKENM